MRFFIPSVILMLCVVLPTLWFAPDIVRRYRELRENKNKSKKGFTLIELIVVITILAILGTIGFVSIQWPDKVNEKKKECQRLIDLKKEYLPIECKSYFWKSNE